MTIQRAHLTAKAGTWIASALLLIASAACNDHSTPPAPPPPPAQVTEVPPPAADAGPVAVASPPAEHHLAAPAAKPAVPETKHAETTPKPAAAPTKPVITVPARQSDLAGRQCTRDTECGHEEECLKGHCTRTMPTFPGERSGELP